MACWHYLKTEPFKSRQILSAGYVTDCSTIIELGGYHTPITSFLTHPFKQAVSVDPLTPAKQEGNILHIAKDYREVDFSPYISGHYALVMLGMDLPFSQKLYYLIAHAKKVVIEFPQDHNPSLKLFEEILLRTDLKQEAFIQLNLSENDFSHLKDSHKVFPFRTLYVLSTGKMS